MDVAGHIIITRCLPLRRLPGGGWTSWWLWFTGSGWYWLTAHHDSHRECSVDAWGAVIRFWGGAKLQGSWCDLICVLSNCSVWLCRVTISQSPLEVNEWGYLSEDLSVSEAHSARSINPHNVLIMLSNLNNLFSFVPFPWVSLDLVLNVHMVTHC